MAYTYKTLANFQSNGPIMKQLGPYQVTVLAANYASGDTANFARLALSYINAAVQNIEKNLPEDSQVELTLPDLHGQAESLATKLNQEFAQGKIKLSGSVIAPWPGSNQIAFLDSSGHLVLRWVKKEWELYVVIGVLVVILGYALYTLLRDSQYIMKLRKVLQQHGITPPAGSGTFGSLPGVGTPGNFLGWIVANWQLVALGGGALVAAPFVISHVASTESSLNRLHAAERQGRGGR